MWVCGLNKCWNLFSNIDLTHDGNLRSNVDIIQHIAVYVENMNNSNTIECTLGNNV